MTTSLGKSLDAHLAALEARLKALEGRVGAPERPGILAEALTPRAVRAALNKAKPGDTVNIPAGEIEGWAEKVIIRRPVHIRGAGKDKTRIKRKSGKILEMFDVRTDGFRLSDVTLEGRGYKDGSEDVGIYIRGAWRDTVIERVRFVHFGMAAVQVRVQGTGKSGITPTGVIADCDFERLNSKPKTRSGAGGYGVLIHMDKSTWNRPHGFGGPEFIFVEDCRFKDSRHPVAGNNGAKYVLRHSEADGPVNQGRFAAVDAHGWQGEVWGWPAGSRAIEIYKNRIHSPGTYAAILWRGGAGLVYDNDLLANNGLIMTVEQHGTKGGNKKLPKYPARHQIGWKRPGNDEREPAYVWGNRYRGNGKGGGKALLIYRQDRHLRKGRDYHLKPFDYEPYPYPHPARTL